LIRRVVIIGGPTASGKSSLAVGLAQEANGVIINADSMQLYRGLPLLTAQPSLQEQSEAPHRLYNTLAPDDICSAARWRGMALDEIDSALQKNKLPIIVGGTGFYINSLLKGLSPIPEVPAEIRARAIARQKELGNPGLHAELSLRDPETAARLDAYNTQRVTRAWEVLEATGKGLAYWHKALPLPPPMHFDFLTVTLIPPRETLYKKCDDRFTQMLEMGALEEAEKFRSEKNSAGIQSSPLDKALGYQELCDYMDGAITMKTAIEKSQQDTRNYAKRQTTWFRNQITADLPLKEADAAAILRAL
jgi:tRNA dimethylallyltransferase